MFPTCDALVFAVGFDRVSLEYMSVIFITYWLLGMVHGKRLRTSMATDFSGLRDGKNRDDR